MRIGQALVSGCFFAALAVASFGACAQFSSGECTDKALCDPNAEASTNDTTTTKDGPVDVNIDTIVAPDVVPDGECNGGVEDCSNGQDDNCNGLVDCADPVCQGAGYVCTPPPATGWNGPVAFYSVAGGTIPSCAGAYATLAQSGHMGLNAPPAVCGCSCNGPTGEGCFPDIDYFFDTNCGSYNQSDGLPFNFCTNVGTGNGSVKGKPGVAMGGSCGPNPSKSIPTNSWSNSYATCSYNAKTDTGGCQNSSLCVQSPGTGAWAKPCVWQMGDVSCPAVYTQKATIYTSDTDSRGCTPCSCTYSPGSCTAPLTVWTAGSCSGTSLAISTDNTCHQFAGWSAIAGSITNTAGSCAGSSVTPNGTDVPAGPVTVCCTP